MCLYISAVSCCKDTGFFAAMQKEAVFLKPYFRSKTTSVEQATTTQKTLLPYSIEIR
jgi:hypothetical protein